MNISTLFESAQFVSFFCLLAIGFVYLIGTFAISEIGDLFGGDAPDASAESHDTISVFSPTVVAIFLVGFGGVGSIATYYGISVVLSSLMSLVSGAALGGLAYLGINALSRQQSDSSVEPLGAVGKIATVTLDIPSQGLGEVGLTVNGQYMTYTAKHHGVSPIRRGQSVKVTMVNGSLLHVQAI